MYYSYYPLFFRLLEVILRIHICAQWSTQCANYNLYSFFFFLIQFIFPLSIYHLCGSEAGFVFIYSKFELKNALWMFKILIYFYDAYNNGYSISINMYSIKCKSRDTWDSWVFYSSIVIIWCKNRSYYSLVFINSCLL